MDRIRIDIKFTSEQKELLRIPEEIKAPQFSLVQWNIVFPDPPYGLRGRGLIFTIYFGDASPFPWKRQFVQLHGDRALFPNRVIRLAEEVASEKGAFKYGVKVEEADSNETLYDEDPYLIIY